MDTYKCTSCNKKISKLCKVCPECGGQLKKSISVHSPKASDAVESIADVVMTVAEVILDIVTD